MVSVLSRLDNESNEANSDMSVRASEESPSDQGLTVPISLALDLVIGIVFQRQDKIGSRFVDVKKKVEAIV